MNITSRLQSRISKRSRDVTRYEELLVELTEKPEIKAIKEWLSMLRDNQQLDKRCMGAIIRLSSERKTLRRVILSA